MLSLILFVLIGLKLNMLHGLYLAVVIIYLVMSIIHLILTVIKFGIKMINKDY